MKATGRLENWLWHPFYESVIVGQIYDDIKERFEDGKQIRTSTVLEIKDNLCFTRNSIYELGEKANE